MVSPASSPAHDHLEDLSLVHSPLSRLFTQPRTPAEWAQYQLSEQQIAQFRAQGYLTGVRVLSEEQCDVLCAELEQISDPAHPRYSRWYSPEVQEEANSADPTQVLTHALGAWRVGVGFHDLLWAPAFRMAAWQLLGGDFRFYHDQLFAKPPSNGGVVSWVRPRAPAWLPA